MFLGIFFVFVRLLGLRGRAGEREGRAGEREGRREGGRGGGFFLGLIPSHF